MSSTQFPEFISALKNVKAADRLAQVKSLNLGLAQLKALAVELAKTDKKLFDGLIKEIADVVTSEEAKLIFDSARVKATIETISSMTEVVNSIPSDIILPDVKEDFTLITNNAKFLMDLVGGTLDKTASYKFQTMTSEFEPTLKMLGINYSVVSEKYEHEHIGALSHPDAKILVNELAKLAKAVTVKLSGIGANYKSTGKVDVVYRAYKNN